MAAPMARNLRKIALTKQNLFKPFFSSISTTITTQNKEEFDVKDLEVLVCPLSKKPLRYNPETNELISDEINVAYPIINGIPNLIPQDGRIIKDDTTQDNK